MGGGRATIHRHSAKPGLGPSLHLTLTTTGGWEEREEILLGPFYR